MEKKMLLEIQHSKENKTLKTTNTVPHTIKKTSQNKLSLKKHISVLKDLSLFTSNKLFYHFL